MGDGRKYICKKCGYRLDATWGCGFMFPKVYAETKEKMLSGELGAEAKSFLEEHPDGAVDCEWTLAQCTECGQYETVMDLTMYIPKEGYVKKADPDRKWSTAAPFKGADYVTWRNLRENYTVYKKYPHECSNCKGKMRLLPLDIYDANAKNYFDAQKMNEEVNHLRCPVCGEILSVSSIYNWD